MEVALDHIARAGAKDVDLWSCPPICNHVDPETRSAAQVRRLLADSGLRIGPLSIYLTDRENRRRRMEYAAEIGADSVVFEPAPLAGFHEKMTGLDLKGKTLGEPGEDWGRFVENLSEYLALAERLGLKIALEVPHLYTLVETPNDVERLNREISSPALAYCLAPTHTLARRRSVEETIRACGDRLWVFYLWDVRPGYDPVDGERSFGDGEQQLPGLGSLDWSAIGAVLDEIGFRGYSDMKCHSTEKWTDLERLDDSVGRSARRIRSLMKL